ncbi:MAG TPA: hypothetical protein VNT22_08290 [Baekduia sp.]|nr:hypothetical protein [Baekduia sp.]
MRVLLVGGGIGVGGSGDRGLQLARVLISEGHAVRAAVDESHRAAVEAAGCECWVGDPDRIGSLRYALENVTVLLWMLGDVDRAELHGPRLQMMMERTIDTTVRGVTYETFGPHGDEGREVVVRMATKNEIPFVLIDRDPEDVDAWLAAVLSGIEQITSVDRAELQRAALQRSA